MAATKNKRQPVHHKLRHGHITDRDAVWAAIRELGEFGISDIEDKTRVATGTIKTYVVGLAKAGYLTRIEGLQREKNAKGKFIESRWCLARDVGADTPRVTRDGKEVTQGKVRENLWRTLRIIADFTARELASTASTEETPVKFSDAKDYIKYLHKAGYLVLVQPAKPGHKPGTGAQARYRFLKSRYTGPRPPMVQRIRQVFDPNLGEVVWPKEDTAND